MNRDVKSREKGEFITVTHTNLDSLENQLSKVFLGAIDLKWRRKQSPFSLQ